jgi:hypothetical protein
MKKHCKVRLQVVGDDFLVRNTAELISKTALLIESVALPMSKTMLFIEGIIFQVG